MNYEEIINQEIRKRGSILGIFEPRIKTAEGHPRQRGGSAMGYR
jgi:hypothetical protein